MNIIFKRNFKSLNSLYKNHNLISRSYATPFRKNNIDRSGYQYDTKLLNEETDIRNHDSSKTFSRKESEVYGSHTLEFLTVQKNVLLPNIKPPQPKHNILKATITMVGYIPDWLESVIAFSEYTAAQLSIPFVNSNEQKRTIQRWWTIKSHFIYAKSKEIFERRTHERTFQVYDVDNDTLKFYIKRLRDSLPPGIKMKVSIFDFHNIDEPPIIPPSDILGLKLRSDTLPYPNINKPRTGNVLETFAEQLGAPVEDSKDSKLDKDNLIHIIPKSRIDNLSKSNSFENQVYDQVKLFLNKFSDKNTKSRKSK